MAAKNHKTQTINQPKQNQAKPKIGLHPILNPREVRHSRAADKRQTNLNKTMACCQWIQTRLGPDQFKFM